MNLLLHMPIVPPLPLDGSLNQKFVAKQFESNIIFTKKYWGESRGEGCNKSEVKY